MRDEARPWQTFIPVKFPFFRVGLLSESRRPDTRRRRLPVSERDHNWSCVDCVKSAVQLRLAISRR